MNERTLRRNNSILAALASKVSNTLKGIECAGHRLQKNVPLGWSTPLQECSVADLNFFESRREHTIADKS